MPCRHNISLLIRCHECEGEAGPQVVTDRRTYLANLEKSYPWIAWREPITISNFEGLTRLGCRICIAERGLKAEEIKDLPSLYYSHRKHLKEYHFLEVS